MTDNIWPIALAIVIVAFLYSAIGHAGASGYIAVMTIMGLAPASIKPIALVLNILVATIGSWQFWRSGYFSWPLFYPLAIGSIPMAAIGGYFHLPTPILRLILGIILWCSALWFFIHPQEVNQPQTPPIIVSLSTGALIGLLAGFTGTGGGIFLTPLAISWRWAMVKNVAAVSVVFILANSLAGLAGYVGNNQKIPTFTPVLLLAAGVGGILGAYLGSRYFPVSVIKRILAVVLAIAGYKLIFV